MKTKRKSSLHKKLHDHSCKYARWMKLYVRRVRAVEREIGEPIEAC